MKFFTFKFILIFALSFCYTNNYAIDENYDTSDFIVSQINQHQFIVDSNDKQLTFHINVYNCEGSLLMKQECTGKSIIEIPKKASNAALYYVIYASNGKMLSGSFPSTKAYESKEITS